MDPLISDSSITGLGGIDRRSLNCVALDDDPCRSQLIKKQQRASTASVLDDQGVSFRRSLTYSRLLCENESLTDVAGTSGNRVRARQARSHILSTGRSERENESRADRLGAEAAACRLCSSTSATPTIHEILRSLEAGGQVSCPLLPPVRTRPRLPPRSFDQSSRSVELDGHRPLFHHRACRGIDPRGPALAVSRHSESPKTHRVTQPPRYLVHTFVSLMAKGHMH